MNLGGLGSLAGGISEGLGNQLQINNDNTATGLAYYAKYGVTPPSTGLFGLGSLFGQGQQQGMGSVASNAPQQTSISPPPQTQASAPPSMGQGGVAQSPVPTPQPSQPLSITPPSQVSSTQTPLSTPPDLAPPTAQGTPTSVVQPPQTQASPLPKGAPQ